MESVLQEALSLYQFENPRVELLRHNENITYCVTDVKKYVMRIHKPVEGFTFGIFNTTAHSADSLRGEIEFITALQKTEIHVQRPVKNRQGDTVSLLSDGTPVTVLEWLEGECLDSMEMSEEILVSIGEMVAKMRICSQKMGNAINRYYYDRTMLPVISKNIVKAKEDGFIEAEHAAHISNAIEEILLRMEIMDSKGEEKGLVHTDLSRSNMIYHRGKVSPIDFGVCGYSHYYMDIGSLFGHFSDNAHRKIIVNSYENSIGSRVDYHYVEPYFALQVLLFIASQYERSRDWDWFGDSVERWCRDIFKPLQKREAFLC